MERVGAVGILEDGSGRGAGGRHLFVPYRGKILGMGAKPIFLLPRFDSG